MCSPKLIIQARGNTHACRNKNQLQGLKPSVNSNKICVLQCQHKELHRMQAFKTVTRKFISRAQSNHFDTTKKHNTNKSTVFPLLRRFLSYCFQQMHHQSFQTQTTCSFAPYNRKKCDVHSRRKQIR